MGVGHTNHCKILRVKLCILKLVEDYHVYLHIMYYSQTEGVQGHAILFIL